MLNKIKQHSCNEETILDHQFDFIDSYLTDVFLDLSKGFHMTKFDLLYKMINLYHPKKFVTTFSPSWKLPDQN